ELAGGAGGVRGVDARGVVDTVELGRLVERIGALRTFRTADAAGPADRAHRALAEYMVSLSTGGGLGCVPISPAMRIFAISIIVAACGGRAPDARAPPRAASAA